MYIYIVYDNGNVYFNVLKNLTNNMQINANIGSIQSDLKFYWRWNYCFFISKAQIYYHDSINNNVLKLNGCFDISLFESIKI